MWGITFWATLVPLENKSFGWECSHSCTACCTSSFDLKDLPPITSLRGPKKWKLLGARSGDYGGCGRHLKDRSWIVATVERAVWGRALSCCNKTPVLRLPRLLVLIAGRRWFLRRSAYVALVTVFLLGMKCFKITPHSSQKKVSITFPTDGCVRNFFGFGEEVWRHSWLALLVSGWW